MTAVAPGPAGSGADPGPGADPCAEPGGAQDGARGGARNRPQGGARGGAQEDGRTGARPGVHHGKQSDAPSGALPGASAGPLLGTSEDLLTATYQAHYRSLLRLAALLLDDLSTCEDVVQEAFIRVHAARRRVREPEKTLAYLRQTVVNLSRSTLRRRILGLRLLPKPMPDMASAEEGAYDALERDQLKAALRGLQRRQREVLVLRYFVDMTEAQVADTLGISLGSVKAYGSRGLAALRAQMEAGHG